MQRLLSLSSGPFLFLLLLLVLLLVVQASNSAPPSSSPKLRTVLFHDGDELESAGRESLSNHKDFLDNASQLKQRPSVKRESGRRLRREPSSHYTSSTSVSAAVSPEMPKKQPRHSAKLAADADAGGGGASTSDQPFIAYRTLLNDIIYEEEGIEVEEEKVEMQGYVMNHKLENNVHHEDLLKKNDDDDDEEDFVISSPPSFPSTLHDLSQDTSSDELVNNTSFELDGGEMHELQQLDEIIKYESEDDDDNDSLPGRWLTQEDIMAHLIGAEDAAYAHLDFSTPTSCGGYTDDYSKFQDEVLKSLLSHKKNTKGNTYTSSSGTFEDDIDTMLSLESIDIHDQEPTPPSSNHNSPHRNHNIKKSGNRKSMKKDAKSINRKYASSSSSSKDVPTPPITPDII